MLDGHCGNSSLEFAVKNMPKFREKKPMRPLTRLLSISVCASDLVREVD
jgi:hypothetical protein